MPPSQHLCRTSAMNAQDTVFQSDESVSDFSFDKQVAAVFDNMVSRSVPFYDEVQHMQADLAMSLLPEEDCLIVDLGCSTGTTIDLLVSHPRCPAAASFLGIDNSLPMLAEAKAKLAGPIAEGRVTLLNADLKSSAEIPKCNLIIMNWTLQFVRPLYRESLVRRVF